MGRFFFFKYTLLKCLRWQKKKEKGGFLKRVRIFFRFLLFFLFFFLNWKSKKISPKFYFSCVLLAAAAGGDPGAKGVQGVHGRGGPGFFFGGGKDSWTRGDFMNDFFVECKIRHYLHSATVCDPFSVVAAKEMKKKKRPKKRGKKRKKTHTHHSSALIHR